MGNQGMKDRSRRIGMLFALISLFTLQPLAGAHAQVEPTIDCTLDSIGAIPITDLAGATYQGAEGGLYPGGVNSIPADHAALGLWHASQIEPLDPSGSPDADGAVVLVSIGVSNTRQEFSAFRQIARGVTAPAVLVVNGSQGGEPISSWLSVDDPTWDTIDEKLADANVTPAQVQAAWVKLPERILDVDAIEPFPIDAETYQADLTAVLQNARDRYPNLRVAYLSSRIYGGYNTSGRPSPEPLAYENGFGVKWTIEDQITGSLELNADPRRGEIEAPWLAWGPYLWADGATARSDGLTWECSDLRSDGTHPSDEGTEKVGAMLLDHFLTSPTTAPWFPAGAEGLGTVELPPLSTQVPVTTTTTTIAGTTTSSTTTTAVTSTTSNDVTPAAAAPEQPARPGGRRNAPTPSDSPSPELLLIGTALALAAALAVAALVGRTRRREE